MDGWTGREAADEVGVTYRQLDYWARTDLIRPSLADANGSGSRRRYSDQDIATLRMVKDLLDAGLRLERIRSALTFLDQTDPADLGEAFVVIARSEVHLAKNTAELVDLVLFLGGVLAIRRVG